jgi:hypothetical protein
MLELCGGDAIAFVSSVNGPRDEYRSSEGFGGAVLLIYELLGSFFFFKNYFF